MREKRYCCEKHPTRPTTKSQRNNSNIFWTSLSLKCNQHVRHRWCPRPCILSFVQHNDVAQLLLQTPLRNGTNPRGPTRNGNKNIGHRWCPRLSVQLSFVQRNAAAQLLLPSLRCATELLTVALVDISKHLLLAARSAKWMHSVAEDFPEKRPRCALSPCKHLWMKSLSLSLFYSPKECSLCQATSPHDSLILKSLEYI